MGSPLAYAKQAYAALLQHGKSTTILTYSDSYTAGTGINTRTPTSHTVQTSPLIAYEDKYIDSDLILQGDAMLIIANYNLDFTPVNGMIVDTVWYVVSVKSHNYQDATVAYELQVRKI